MPTDILANKLAISAGNEFQLRPTCKLVNATLLTENKPIVGGWLAVQTSAKCELEDSQRQAEIKQNHSG